MRGPASGYSLEDVFPRLQRLRLQSATTRQLAARLDLPERRVYYLLSERTSTEARRATALSPIEVDAILTATGEHWRTVRSSESPPL
jgi:hypothetical protein